MMGSFSSWLGFSTLALFLFDIHQTSAECQSYGVDYVDGGSYFINTESPDYFSFVSEFEGCTDQETIKPLLVDPNGDEYFCSDIRTLPNGEYKLSTCNVAGNELLKADMFSGTWIIISEGLTFAWMREFDITTGVQSRTTVTPTSQVVFNFTTQSTLTDTTTSFQTVNSTLPAHTVVLPSETATGTHTVTPPEETITSTMSLVQTIEIPKFTVTDVTATVTAACNLLSWAPRADRRLTYLPTKTDLGAKVKVTGSSESSLSNDLADRDIDAPTVTVTASPVFETLTSTITAPPTTITVSSIATTTKVITPPPVTMLSGIAQATVTAPTPTRTSLTITAGITTAERTITATKTKYSTMTPSAPCFPFDIPFLGPIA